MPQAQSHNEKPQGSQAVAAEDSTDNCNACGRPLRGSQFCVRCGRPELPPEGEVNSMSAGKAFASIILMILSFTTVAITKLDIEINLFATEPRVEPVVSTKNRPQGNDLKVTHVVNVLMANVRQRPSPKDIIVMVLKKDTRVEILEIKGKWTRIAAHDKTGWIFSELVTAQVE